MMMRRITVTTVGMAMAMAMLPLCFGPNQFTAPSRTIALIVAMGSHFSGTPK